MKESIKTRNMLRRKAATNFWKARKYPHSNHLHYLYQGEYLAFDYAQNLLGIQKNKYLDELENLIINFRSPDTEALTDLALSLREKFFPPTF